MNLEAMRPDCIVLRHSSSGAPLMLSRLLNCSVINAGDGFHEHPSQALLDLFTVSEQRESIEGIKVVIVGDIRHSRVARSNIYAFTKLGAEVTVCGPPTMIPVGIEDLGCKVECDMERAIEGADVIMMLRIQMERQRGALIPTLREYSNLYGLTSERLAGAKEELMILHPGPMNRGVEISPEVADGPYSLITDQVTNGVALRMALFYLLIGGAKEEREESE
jgi:aspartate carbamoyltransferase catalytic subunit